MIIRFTKADVFFVLICFFCVFVAGIATGLGWNFYDVQAELMRTIQSLNETATIKPGR